jgi:hypothetical protein
MNRFRFEFWLPPRDSNPDMLIQSQLSHKLPLLLICPDYAICICTLKGVGDPQMHRIGAGQSGKTRENCGNIIQLLPVLLPVIDDVWLTHNPSVNSRMLRLGVHMLSTECRGAKGNDRSLCGAQFGEKFGEVVVRDNSATGR